MSNMISRLFLLSTAFITLSAVTISDVRADESFEQVKARERKIMDTVRAVMPATVCVTDGVGFGSGVVVSEDGYVLTAGHVLTTDGKRLRVIFPNGREVEAKRLGKNLSADAGMLKLTEEGPWPFVALAESGSIKRGDWCIAIGHSGGYKLGRTPPVRTGRILNTNDRRIVSDCALIGGDSGGPLFDLDAKLIGINSSIGTSIAENRHVSMDVYRNDWARLEGGETWGKLAELSKARPNGPMLGIKLNKSLDNLAEVQRVSEGSPADAAGLRRGDFITAIDGEAMIDWQHVVDTIADRDVGDKVRISVKRGSENVELTAKLRRRDQ